MAEKKKSAASKEYQARTAGRKVTKGTERAGASKATRAVRQAQNKGVADGTVRLGKSGKSYNVYDAKSGTWKRGVVQAAPASSASPKKNDTPKKPEVSKKPERPNIKQTPPRRDPAQALRDARSGSRTGKPLRSPIDVSGFVSTRLRGRSSSNPVK